MLKLKDRFKIGRVIEKSRNSISFESICKFRNLQHETIGGDGKNSLIVNI
jgi:hypothetical protein